MYKLSEAFGFSSSLFDFCMYDLWWMCVCVGAYERSLCESMASVFDLRVLLTAGGCLYVHTSSDE